MPRPSLMDLSPEFLRTQEATSHLAIEALRDLIAKESVKATGQTLRQQAFADRIAELMRSTRTSS